MSYALWWIMHYEVMHYDLFNCNHLNVSGAIVVGIDAHHRKAEFKIHSLNLDDSEPPVDSAIILESRYNTNYFIHYPTT